MLARLPKSTLILLAFASVYLFWGSTYGAIRIADEHLPVMVVSGTRCLCSVVMIVVICLLRGKSMRVVPGETGKLALIGLLFMSANNMLLTWGETMVPSGFAALVISTIPILIALLETALALLSGQRGDTLTARGWAGTLLASAGILLLVWPALHGYGGNGYTRPLLGVFVLLGAALSFAVGSVLSRRFNFKTESFVATGWQIGAAGLFNTALGISTGALHRAVWTWQGFAAILYLAIFGSLFGLVAFTYLLKHVPVTQVATYAFVNPAIAVLLGVLVLHERLDSMEVLGMFVIVCGVALVVLRRSVAKIEPALAGEAMP